MATKIRGITVEIGGDASGLEKALSGVNSKARSVQRELKDVERLLKLDPKNTELLAQKQKLLAENVSTAKEKLEALKQAEEQMKAGGVDKNSEQYRALQREIVSTEQSLKKAEKAAKEFGSVKLQKLKGEMQEVSDKAGKISEKTAGISKVAQGALGGLAGVAGAAVKKYAEAEQLIGGVDILFKKSSKRVQTYANEAYKSAGMSAVDYLETVTTFSASLISSLGGDTEKAADIANMAIVDMSDNVNTFGSDIEAVQNAYRGFSKQNFTMLDNLSLGFAGSKEGMEALLKKAEEFSDIKYDISSYSDIVQAIHVIQENMDITGKTAEEASGTITGSFEAVKSSIDNLLTGAGQADADIDTLTQNVVDSVTNMVNNVLPVLQNLWDNLPGGAKTGIIITAAIAAISPVAGIISSITGAVGALTAVSLPMLGTIALIIAAVAAVIAIGVALYKHWDEIKAKVAELKDEVVGKFNEIKDGITEKVNAIKQKASDTFAAVKYAITHPIETARDFVKKQIDKIRSFFNFSWSLPKLKMPHFNITGKFSLNPPSIPHIGVEWYAKAMQNGMIMNKPTVFGMNGTNLMAGGEAGSEVVVGTNSLMSMIQKAAGGKNITMNVYGAPGQDVSQLADIVMDKIQFATDRRAAVFG